DAVTLWRFRLFTSLIKVTRIRSRPCRSLNCSLAAGVYRTAADGLTKVTVLVAGLNPNLLHAGDRRTQRAALAEHQHTPLNMHGPRAGRHPWLLATKSRLGSCSLFRALSRRHCSVLARKDHWFSCVAAGMESDICSCRRVFAY